MIRSKLPLLLVAALALAASLPAHARDTACQAIAVRSAGQSLLLRNGSTRAITVSLRFEDEAGASHACSQLSLAAGTDTGRQTLASLCPASSSMQSAGTLRACRAPIAAHTHRGAPTGDLLADVQANNLDVAGR